MKYSVQMNITAESDGATEFKATCLIEPEVTMDPDSAILFKDQIELASRLLLGSLIKNGPATPQEGLVQ